MVDNRAAVLSRNGLGRCDFLCAVCAAGDPLLCMVVKDPKQGAREVSYLLAAGVDPTQKTMDGKTALDLARELNRQDLVPLLQAAMPLPAAPPARGK